MSGYKPLEGLRVLELGNMVAMASAGRCFVDLGADVIKIENTATGDQMRSWPAQMGIPNDEDFTPVFDDLNSGKRSISIDTNSDEGREAIYKLMENADFFLTNVRDGGLKKKGLDWDTLHAKFPKLIMAGLTGYGHKGAEAGRPGYDTSSFWARGGFLYSQAIKGGNPAYFPMGLGDIACGMGLVAACLMAHQAVLAGGEGDYVYTSLYGMAAWVENIMITGDQFEEGTVHFPMTREGGSPYGIPYKCKDGYWFLPQIVKVPRDHEKYYNLIGHPELNDDERFATRPGVMENGLGPALIKMCEEGFAKLDSKDVVKYFEENDLPGELLYKYNDVVTDPQALANNFMFEYTYPNGKKCYMASTSVGTESMDPKGPDNFVPGPLLGADTREVLQEAGYSDSQIDELIASNVVKQHD